MDDRHKEIAELRAANRILAEENAQLSERAEDAMLLALVAEAIEGVTDPQQVIEQVVERISILKDLPFVTCGRLSNGDVERIGSYSSFSDQETIGYPLGLSVEILSELRQGPYISESLAGISLTLDRDVFGPRSALAIPFRCHQHGPGVFLFFDRPLQQDRLSRMIFLLDQVVRLTCSRLDTLFLARQLELLNAQLEERVLLRTRDLRAANDRLQQMYDRFVAILHGVDAYIHVTDSRDYTILFANSTAKRLFGEKLEGKKCHAAFRQKSKPCSFCKVPELLAARDSVDPVVTWESKNPGTGRWFLNSERIVDWPSAPEAILTIGTDISKVKAAEEEKQLLAEKLHQAQKMEAIGVLAGSIAHDLNNILSGVVSYPDLLLATMELDPPLRKALETIRSAGSRGAKIVQGLLTLSRKGVLVEEVVDLGRVLDDYLESPELRDLLQKHENVRIAVSSTKQDLNVKGSREHLSNVLMNLVINGAEAMVDGGVVTISLDRVELHRQPPGFVAWRPGPYARITVSDTGAGIPAPYVERIFEPFFSLKGHGRSGTGLGLAVVWGTVIDHRGSIEVETVEGEGTSFNLLLPLVDGEKAPAASGDVPAVMTGRGQTVLVVDDNEQQRLIAAEILAHLGYHVTAVSSGEAAILELQTNPMDLVVLDMLMEPGIDGLETYERIIAVRPGQKALIVSGFSQSERVKKALSLGVGGYLQKPYTLASLGEAVHDALEG